MQVDWIKKGESDKLIVMALGWGASVDVVVNLNFDGYDVVALCDYKKLDVNVKSLLEGYSEVNLIAWSFGVWASEQLLGEVAFNKAIALGGTPKPIDRRFGIAPRIFDLTLIGIQNDGVAQFVVRMCGRHLKKYLGNFSKRSLDDCKEELTILDKVGRVEYVPKVRWSCFVGMGADLVFPCSSVRNYASENGFKFELLEGVPHYPFYNDDFVLWAIKSL